MVYLALTNEQASLRYQELNQVSQMAITKHRGNKRIVLLGAFLVVAAVAGVILSGGLLAIPLLGAVMAKLTVAGTGVAASTFTFAAECGLFSVYNRVKNKKWTARPMTHSYIKISQLKQPPFKPLRR